MTLTRRSALCLALAAALGAPAASTATAAPKRVVALTPYAANALASFGVVPVGVGQTLGGADRLSPALRSARRLPLAHPNGANLEQVAALRPDLVVTTRAWRRGSAGMRNLGLRVVESDLTKIADVPVATRRLGRLVGRPRQAERLARRQARDLAAAQRSIRLRPSVLLLLGVGRTPYAFLPSTWGGDVVRAAGGRLLTEGLRASGGYAKLSDETIRARNPDVIIAVPHGTPDDVGRLARYLASNPAWKDTDAARNGRIHVATGNSLLQPYTDAARTVRDVRRKYLRNG